MVRFWRNFVGEKLLMEGEKIEVFLLFFYSLGGLLIIADAVDWKEDSEIRWTLTNCWSIFVGFIIYYYIIIYYVLLIYF